MSFQSNLSRPRDPQRGRINIVTSNSDQANPPVFEAFEDDDVTPRAPSSPVLSVLSVDMRAVDNKKAHNTSRYKNPSLIVRRNQEFIIVLQFDRPFNGKRDNVQLEFMIGSAPDKNKGTYMNVSLGREKSDGRWKGRVLDAQGNYVTVGITPDSNCIVGRFCTFVVVISDIGKQRTPKNPDTDVYVLFNPWDPADQVYMPKDSDRQEYVLNDVGIIYNGEYKNITSRTWNFGQFEKGVLDACLFALDAGKVPLLFRGNANEIVRQGSALINAQDDNGVLVGNWSGDYSVGTAPTAWTGSPEILLKYARSGGVPVCFAQCWVFAGVLNTFVRCLGIPVRVITNYCSAHDNGGDLKTDIVLDDDGTVNRSRTRDSVWNYHCWNEVFMRRPDLADRFSGWQVIDSTPQETSDGLYRCGPTSVNAIKAGELSFSFDARFVFAEVHSDVVYHQTDKYGNSKIIHVDTTYVGKLIITKRPNSNTYEDITSNYKYPEGTDMDKQTQQRAKGSGVFKETYPPLTDAGVSIDLQAGTIQMGDDFKLTMNVKNKSSQTCTVNVTVSGSVVYYTGVTGKTFMVQKYSVTVNAWSTKTVMIDVLSKDYMPNLVEQANLMFMVSGRVKETGASLSTMRTVALQPPELKMKIIGVPRVGQDLMVSVSFRNPYKTTLMKAELRLDGPGLTTTKKKTYQQIGPGATIQYTDTITPQASGKKVLIACLDCPGMRQVTNQLEINVL